MATKKATPKMTVKVKDLPAKNRKAVKGGGRAVGEYGKNEQKLWLPILTPSV